MALNNALRIFLPKDKVFNNLFEEISQNLIEMVGILKEGMQETDAQKRKGILDKLEDFEHKNDNLTHKVFVELGQNFITPFDREDIHYLATSLDDIADFMYGSTKKIVNYGIQDIDTYMKQFVDISQTSIGVLAKAVSGLRNMKNVKEIMGHCVEINSLENKADDVLDQAIANLFSNNTNAIEIIKLKDIYQELEIISDKCEDASNVIESIIIKYS